MADEEDHKQIAEAVNATHDNTRRETEDIDGAQNSSAGVSDVSSGDIYRTPFCLTKIKHIPNKKCVTVKPVLSDHSKEDQKLVFKTDNRLIQVKSIAECSNGSILQYFRPSLSYHLPLRLLFCPFLSGRLRQVLLYVSFLLKNLFVNISFKHKNMCV